MDIKIELLNLQPQLRSRKNIMVDGENEEEEPKNSPMFSTPQVITMFIDALGKISTIKGDRMGDIARANKPELQT